MVMGLERSEQIVRRVTILGSTGSVGCNTIDLIERHPEAFSVEALTANSNAELLADQARRLSARLAVVADKACYVDLKRSLQGSGIEVAAGREALIEAANRPADWVMAAIVGVAGLAPTLTAIRRGAIVALANKECLISAGSLMLNEVTKCGATILPVDSEHNAIFQVFDFESHDSIERIILTASGGPFLTYTREDMEAVTPDQAVAHPNWDMGAKISVDSATMMNKGLELIEAHYLFGLTEDRIDILVHPQSIVHSMVAYVDGSVLAQLGTPDMRTPISYTLGWPKRMVTPSAQLNLAQIGNLSFEAPDIQKFPALELARQALKAGGSAPTILNAANEVAVLAFMDGEIRFLDIPRIVAATLEQTATATLDTLDLVHATDQDARETARSIITRGLR